MLRGEGNMVADYQEGKADCYLCNGCGELNFNTHDKLRFFFATHAYSFEEIRKMVKQWQEEGIVTCPECDGGQVDWRR